MKYILQGIGDYIKDCWHDMHLFLVWKLHPHKKRRWQAGHYDYYWKEGSVWHYIQQRKIGNKVKKQRRVK